MCVCICVYVYVGVRLRACVRVCLCVSEGPPWRCVCVCYLCVEKGVWQVLKSGCWQGWEVEASKCLWSVAMCSVSAMLVGESSCGV